jgi:hypothetical protein
MDEYELFETKVIVKVMDMTGSNAKKKKKRNAHATLS